MRVEDELGTVDESSQEGSRSRWITLFGCVLYVMYLKYTNIIIVIINSFMNIPAVLTYICLDCFFCGLCVIIAIW